MSKTSENTKQKPIIIALVVLSIVFIVFIVIGSFVYIQNKKNNEYLVPDEELYIAPVGENTVVNEVEDTYLAEGDALPADLDLTEVLPRFPNTTEINGVTDIYQPGLRIVTVEYNLVRDEKTVKDLIMDTFTKRDWDGIEINQDGSIYAEKGDYQMVIYFEQVDPLKTIVVVELRINEELDLPEEEQVVEEVSPTEYNEDIPDSEWDQYGVN